MRKKIFFLAVAALCVSTSHAKVWRINYDENAKADFKTLTAACTASKVKNTDTLYCEPGYHAADMEDNYITRNGLTVIGPGWGFEPNYGNTATIAEARFTNKVTIRANNVKVTGVLCAEQMAIEGDERTTITIDRCYVKSIYWNNYSIANLTIKNCYITGGIHLYGSWESESSYMRNLYITGNIINMADNPSYQPIEIDGLADIITNINILNNTIVGNWEDGLIQTQNTLIQDNIIINMDESTAETYVLDFAQTGNIIRKNVFSLSTENVNAYISENYPDNYYQGATPENTFVCTSGTKYRTEEYFRLLSSSPAKGGAYNGGDCGAFGGTSPYVVCGRPQGIPYIYDVEAAAQPTNNQLHVTFKVKGQDE